MTAKKRYGVTVSLYLDGSGVDSSDICLSCENENTAHKCGFALGEMSPMSEGMPCSFREGGSCALPAAKLAALRAAKHFLMAEIRKLEELVADILD